MIATSVSPTPIHCANMVGELVVPRLSKYVLRKISTVSLGPQYLSLPNPQLSPPNP